MHEQDILDLMLSALVCDPHGAFSAKDKRLQFDRLREHAAALVRCMHGSLTVQEPSEHRPNACLTLGVPLPVVVLNASVRRHFPCSWHSATAYRCPAQAAVCALAVPSAARGRAHEHSRQKTDSFAPRGLWRGFSKGTGMRRFS